MTTRQYSAAGWYLTLALSGFEAGEDASRLDLENFELILFRLPPCRSHPLGPTTPAAFITG